MRPEQTHALSALATLMEVPEEQQEQFIYNINASLDHIKEDWRVHDAVVVRGLSLGNLAAAVHKVTSELLKLSDDDRRLIDYTLYEMTERKRDLGEVARHHPSFPRADLFLP